MKNVFLHFNLIVLFLLESNFTLEHRSKRFLLFPRKRSPPEMNMKAAIGLPVHLEMETVVIGYTIGAKFSIPENASVLWHHLEDPFNETGRSITKRAIQKALVPESNDFENEQKYDSETVEFDRNRMENDIDSTEKTNNLATMRWTVYKALAEIAERHGFAGRSCVLRSICESAHSPFDYSSGILGEIFHIVMSPSLTHEEIFNHEDNEYLYAEAMGKNGAPCERIFDECKNSLLDIFARIDTVP